MAAGDILIVRGTPIVFADAAQTPDAQLTLAGLGFDTARISARYDLGDAAVTPAPHGYIVRATFRFKVTVTVEETAIVHISTSDGTNPDGQEGIVDAAVSSLTKLRNMNQVLAVTVDDTAAETDTTRSGVVQLLDRYVSIVVRAPLSTSFSDTTTASRVELTPFWERVEQ